MIVLKLNKYSIVKKLQSYYKHKSFLKIMSKLDIHILVTNN